MNTISLIIDSLGAVVILLMIILTKKETRIAWIVAELWCLACLINSLKAILK